MTAPFYLFGPDIDGEIHAATMTDVIEIGIPIDPETGDDLSYLGMKPFTSLTYNKKDGTYGYPAYSVRVEAREAGVSDVHLGGGEEDPMISWERRENGWLLIIHTEEYDDADMSIFLPDDSNEVLWREEDPEGDRVRRIEDWNEVDI